MKNKRKCKSCVILRVSVCGVPSNKEQEKLQTRTCSKDYPYCSCFSLKAYLIQLGTQKKRNQDKNNFHS